MKNFTIIIIIILGLSLDLSAQESISKILSISMSFGPAIPVSSFGKNDIISSAIYTPESVQNPWVIGLDKSKSGFAELGYYFDLKMRYMLNRYIGLHIRTGYTFNGVMTGDITQFLSTNYGDQLFEHDNYKMFHIAPGLGYEKEIGKLNIGISVFSGLARINYPYYESTLLFTTTTPPIIWRHDGEQPTLNAFMIGSALSISYKVTSQLSCGIECSLQNSNFEYSMRTIIIPGGNPNPELHDMLKTHNLNIGLKLQYSFARRQ